MSSIQRDKKDKEGGLGYGHNLYSLWVIQKSVFACTSDAIRLTRRDCTPPTAGETFPLSIVIPAYTNGISFETQSYEYFLQLGFF